MKRVKDLDDAGFQHVQLTTAMTSAVFAPAGNAKPFMDDPKRALVNTFLQNVTTTLKDRWTFSWNIYPYFDPNLHLDGNGKTCSTALRTASDFSSSGYVPSILVAARERMAKLTGSSKDRMWVTETGWSSPKAKTLDTVVGWCKDWNSAEALRDYYEGFLAWDLDIGNGDVGPERVFFFSGRDTTNFGIREYFGLIPDCNSTQCKLNTSTCSGQSPAGGGSGSGSGSDEGGRGSGSGSGSGKGSGSDEGKGSGSDSGEGSGSDSGSDSGFFPRRRRTDYV